MTQKGKEGKRQAKHTLEMRNLGEDDLGQRPAQWFSVSSEQSCELVCSLDFFPVAKMKRALDT